MIRKTGYPEEIILISRTLSEMCEHLGKLPNFPKIYEEGLSFAWAHLDHFVESVGHSAKAFLGGLANWAVIFYKRGELEKVLFQIKMALEN